MYTDLEIYQRMINLLLRLYPKLINYPKSEKYVLAQETRKAFLDYLVYISKANSVKSKRLVYAQEAETYLNLIKTLIYIADRQHYLGKSFYQEISLELTEISKMLASYIKTIK